jgi:hypothetical protein
MSTELKYPLIAKVSVGTQLEAYLPYNNGDRVVLLGEISNMPGHVVLVDSDGKMFWGYHLSDFVPLTIDET